MHRALVCIRDAPLNKLFSTFREENGLRAAQSWGGELTALVLQAEFKRDPRLFCICITPHTSTSISVCIIGVQVIGRYCRKTSSEGAILYAEVVIGKAVKKLVPSQPLSSSLPQFFRVART